MEMIEANAGCGHTEHVRGSAVEIRIELDLDIFGLITIVAATHRRLDAAAVVHACADPKRRVVVDKPNLHVIRRRRALDRLGLEKIGDRARPLPGLVVEAAVESNRTGLDS